MNLLQAIFLGIVQGITEFLPISSSGHLVILQKFLALKDVELLFDINLHLATLLAVIIFFWKDLLKINKKMIFYLVVGTLPAVLVGLFFKDAVEKSFHNFNLAAITLMMTGVLNFITDKKLEPKNKPATIAPRESKVIAFSRPEFFTCFFTIFLY